MSITIEEYRRMWPVREYEAPSGGVVKYRWHENKDSDTAVALLIGTIGNSDAFCEHFGLLAEKYSVLTFDYPEEIERNNQIADCLSELIGSLCGRAWLLGQSLGGFMAQIIAQRHKDIVEGLVLSNTACLAKDMDPAAVLALHRLTEAQNVNLKLVSIAPMDLIKKKLLAVDSALFESFSESQRAHSEAFSELTSRTLTKDRLKHSLTMVVDLPKQFGMVPEDFAYLKGRVLLLLSPDDTLFGEECRAELVKLMPSPIVDSSLNGGHLAIFLQPEEYCAKVSEFIDSVNRKERGNE